MVPTIFNKFISISKEITDFLVKSGVSDEKIIQIPTGVDSNIFKPLNNLKDKENLRVDLGFPVNKNIFLFVGRLVEGKGIDTLLEAWKLFEKTNNDCMLVIVGDVNKNKEKISTSSKPWAKSIDEARIKILNMGIKGVDFLGFRNDVNKLMQASDIFVFPSLSEGLPNVIIEAMMSGLPIIASDIPGNSDLISNDINGILVPVKDIQAFCCAMNLLMSDKNLCKEMGKINRELAKKNFDLAKVSEQFMKLIEEI